MRAVRVMPSLDVTVGDVRVSMKKQLERLGNKHLMAGEVLYRSGEKTR